MRVVLPEPKRPKEWVDANYGGTPEDRFHSRYVVVPNGCFIWTGYLSSGYGYIEVYGRKVGAHQFGYELIHGPVPAGLELDHLCRDRRCVNWRHLEAVTCRVNLLRSPLTVTHKNAAREFCARGHALRVDGGLGRSTSGSYCRLCHNERELARVNRNREAVNTVRRKR